MDNPEKPRTTVPVNLTPAARDVVEQIKDDTGIAKQEAVARVLEWFASQPLRIRLAILMGADAIGLLTEDRVAALSGKGVPTTIDEAAKVARLAVERLASMATAAKTDQIEIPMAAIKPKHK